MRCGIQGHCSQGQLEGSGRVEMRWRRGGIQPGQIVEYRRVPGGFFHGLQQDGFSFGDAAPFQKRPAIRCIKFRIFRFLQNFLCQNIELQLSPPVFHERRVVHMPCPKSDGGHGGEQQSRHPVELAMVLGDERRGFMGAKEELHPLANAEVMPARQILDVTAVDCNFLQRRNECVRMPDDLHGVKICLPLTVS